MISAAASPRPRRIYFHTFGCRTNQYDTERIRQLFELRGCETVGNLADADAVVVNSCTVTQGADSELRRYVRAVGRLTGRDTPVVVAGCAAAVAAEAIGGLEGVRAVVPGQDPEAVANSLGVVARHESEAAPTLLDRASRGTRAWLKVQDGCDLNCSYCIIRVARGRNRSRSPDEIVEERQTRTSVRPFEEPRQIVFSKWIYRESAVTFVFIHEPERGWILDRERSNTIPPVRAVQNPPS